VLHVAYQWLEIDVARGLVMALHDFTDQERNRHRGSASHLAAKRLGAAKPLRRPEDARMVRWIRIHRLTGGPQVPPASSARHERDSTQHRVPRHTIKRPLQIKMCLEVSLFCTTDYVTVLPRLPGMSRSSIFDPPIPTQDQPKTNPK